MQQRVALARALVNRPDVLLLDEPLGALDLKLRRQMQIELKRIQQEVGLTFIHVTHDQEEAMTMADTIAVMNAGHLEQLGDPATLYEHPASTFVANFLGQSNLLRARVTGAGEAGLVRADVHGHEILLEADRVPAGLTDVWVGVRPEKLALGEERRAQPPAGRRSRTSRSPASRRSTSCGCRGAWTSSSSSRTTAAPAPASARPSRCRGTRAASSCSTRAQDDHAGMDQVLVDG